MTPESSVVELYCCTSANGYIYRPFTYLDDTFFTIYLNYPYIVIHIIPALFQGVNHKPVSEHERDCYFAS